MAILLLLHIAFPAVAFPPGAALAADPLLCVAALAALVAATLVLVRPRDALRLLARAVVHGFYRIDHSGFTDIPRRGAALLVANHVSFVDAALIVALSPRPVRFVMDAGIYAHPLMNPVFRAMGAIPIAPARVDRRLLARAQDRIAAALGAGELVCIFPEGAITRDGALAPFRCGVEHIVRRTPVPVVPIGLRGLWGSVFSRARRRTRRTPFGLPRRRLRIASAPPVPPEKVTAEGLQRTVAALVDAPPERPC